MHRNDKTTKITDSEYGTLVHFQDQLIDMEIHENHHLSGILDIIGDTIKEYEDVHVGDMSIVLCSLEVDYEAVYDAHYNGNYDQDVISLGGMIKHIYNDETPFIGYIDFRHYRIVFSDPIRGNICCVNFSNFSKWSEKYNDKLFVRYFEWLMRTGNYWVMTELHDRFSDDVKKILGVNNCE